MPNLLILLSVIAIFLSCRRAEVADDIAHELIPSGAYPALTADGDKYFFTYQTSALDSIFLFSASSIEGLRDAPGKVVWSARDDGMTNIYAPELHRINGKWYMYFEADNGESTDTHQLYVLENSSSDPLSGEWVLHGPIVTSDEWNFGLHPTTFSHAGRQYLLWSGWPKRRAETETQCIYIAEMENPWTLKSERVMISAPEYEWERQWINPDGSRTAYPIYVNENPQVMISPDGKRIAVAYSASGVWTDYMALGLLWADAGSDLLDASSWHKMPEPLFQDRERDDYLGTSNISVIKSDKGGKPAYLMTYELKYRDDKGEVLKRILWKEITWNKDGLPEFGKP